MSQEFIPKYIPKRKENIHVNNVDIFITKLFVLGRER
jgi:hypothetical protein